MKSERMDRKPRYAPRTVFILGSGNVPVLRYIAHPPGHHPQGCSIHSELFALELRTEFGFRFFGFEKAFINSELRMVVSGFSGADYVRSRWEKVPAICLP
jgi:hypothetical protein